MTGLDSTGRLATTFTLATLYISAPATGQCEIGYLTAVGSPAEHLGSTCGFAGDLVVLAAPSDVDAAAQANLFEFDGTRWGEVYRLMPSDAQPIDANGEGSMAADVDLVILGDPRQDGDTGKVWAFERVGSEWIEHAVLASDSVAGDRFGSAVAVLGNVAIIGARGADGMGKAYVFEREASGWVEQQQLSAAGGSVSFGKTIAMDAGVALIGADVRAHVFRDDAGTWIQEETLFAAAGGFPSSLDISGDVAVLGAEPAAEAYVFRRTGDVWSAPVLLIPEGGVFTTSNFGIRVAIEGSRIVVGDDRRSRMSNRTGAVHVFRYNAIDDEWVGGEAFFGSRTADEDRFGRSIAIAGDLFVVGANGTDVWSSNTGAGYVFDMWQTDCPGPGACCLSTDACTELLEYQCIALGGTFLGTDTTCFDSECPEQCPGDVDGDGVVSVSDLLVVLAAWGPCG